MRSFVALGSVFVYFVATMWSYGYFDTTNSWYRESIEAFSREGIVSGYSASRFAPEAEITRAELAKIAVRSVGISTATGGIDCFRDAIDDRSLMQGICSAHREGIVRWKNGLFRPLDTITIGEVLMIGMRANKLLVEGTGSARSSEEYVQMADERGIIWRESYLFNQRATRGIAVEVLWRTREATKKTGKLTNLSVGCTNTTWSLSETNILRINGKDRSYLLAIPKSVARNEAVPLIVAFHGRTNSNSMVRSYMKLEGGTSWDESRNRWNSLGETKAFIAYPAGLSVRWGYSWSEAENIEFFDALISQISKTYCIDKNRLYIVGHSLGAYMANKVSCVRGDIVAGVVAVAGPGYSANCAGPAKTLVIHHPSDRLVTYPQWQTARDQHVSVNQCWAGSQAISAWSLSCSQYTVCSGERSVVWCGGSYPTLWRDPHSWPTGGGQIVLDYLGVR